MYIPSCTESNSKVRTIPMASRHPLGILFSFTTLLAVAACSSLPPSPRELLDEHTGATVTVVGAPILFALERHGAPASAHDYLTLVAVQNDDAGKYTELLLMYRWSAFFGPVPAPPEQSTGELLIDIDGQAIRLQPLERLPPGLPRPKELFVPDTTDAAMRAYVTDLQTMTRIAMSHELTVRLPQESLDAPFTLWRDGRPALAQFVKQLSGP
jgi:hypothetical protein